MNTDTELHTEWQKAEASNGSGNCVEQRRNGRKTQIRDTKDRGAGPILELRTEAYAELLMAAKGGELDSLSQ